MAAKKPGGYRALKGVAILLLVLVILSGALFALLRVTQYLARENHGLPALLGRQYVVEDSDNLTWLYKPNTLVVASPIDGATAGLSQGSVILYTAQDANQVFAGYSLSAVTGSTTIDGTLYWTVRNGRNQPDLVILPKDVVGQVVFSSDWLGKALAFWDSDLGLVCCVLVPFGVLVVLWMILMIWKSHLHTLSRRPLPGYLQEDEGEPVLMNADPFFEDPIPTPTPASAAASAGTKPASPFHYETVSADQQPTMVIPDVAPRSRTIPIVREDPLSDTQEFDVKELKEKLLTDKLLRDVDQEDYVKIPDSPKSDETALMSFGKDSVDFDFRHLDFSKLEVYSNEIGQGFTVLTPDYQAVVRLDITKRESDNQPKKE